MQKLTRVLGPGRQSRGSVLVGVVALALVMGIAAAGYVTLAGSAASHEIQSLHDQHAFNAAESGLLIALSWLRHPENWSGLGGGATDVFNGTVNGMAVDANVVREAGGTIRIESTASGGTLKYRKTLSRQAFVQPFNEATMIDNMSGAAKGDGLLNTVFDGPFHMNTNIVFEQNSNPGSETEVKFVNGPVTVYSPDHATDFLKSDPLGSGDHGGFGDGAYNNYDYGVFHPNYKVGDDHGGDLDEYFTNVFKHTQDSIYLKIAYTNRLDLPVSSGGPAGAYPSVEFLPAGGATYTYYNAGAKTTLNLTAAGINGRVLVAQQDVSVHGTLTGQVSVSTEGVCDIHVVGELKYGTDFNPAAHNSDYDTYNNSANYGLSGANLLALSSGRDILIDAHWRDPASGSVRDFVHDAATSGPDDAYLVGMFFAERQVNWTYTNNMGEFPVKEMRFLGSRSMDSWGPNYFENGNAMDMKFLYDTRLGSSGLVPAGLAVTMYTKDGIGQEQLILVQSSWTETNTPL